MQTAQKKLNKKLSRYSKKLLASALDGFYFFEDDEIENYIELVVGRYNVFNFEYPDGSRSKIRSQILSKPEIRDKIRKIAFNMFEPV